VNIEAEIHEKLPKLVSAFLGEHVEILQEPDDQRADIVLVSPTWRFLVEVKSSGSAEAVSAMLARFRDAPAHRNDRVLPLIVTPYLSRAGRALCDQARISWMDLSGNADISGPGLRVHVQGKPNQYKRPGRRLNLFAPKSSRVARELLERPSTWYSQTELAKATELSPAYVSRIAKRLEEARLVERDEDRRLRSIDPMKMLVVWHEAYDFERHDIRRGHVTTSAGVSLTDTIATTLHRANVSYAATGLVAAWQYDAFSNYRLATFYLERWLEPATIAELGLRNVDSGANVWLAVPRDFSVFRHSKLMGGVKVVSPIQTYLDLKQQPERASEAAQHLLSRIIEAGWIAHA
jgi:DNA-binding transcriptional ArsR family regulator